MAKAILFDLGDTLFDFAPQEPVAVFRSGALRTYNYLRDRGHRLPPFDAFFKAQYSAVRWAYLWAWLRRREFSSLRLLATLCRRLNVPADERMLLELAWECYCPTVDYTSVAQDVAPTLDSLRRRGIKLGIVSNTFVPAAVLDRHLEMTHLLDFFPVRIYSGEVGYRKPDPRIFRIALDRIGAKPQETVFVGDLIKKDIVGARRVGMKTVLRQRMAPTLPRNRGAADAVIQRISQLRDVLPQLTPFGLAQPDEAQGEAVGSLVH